MKVLLVMSVIFFAASSFADPTDSTPVETTSVSPSSSSTLPTTSSVSQSTSPVVTTGSPTTTPPTTVPPTTTSVSPTTSPPTTKPTSPPTTKPTPPTTKPTSPPTTKPTSPPTTKPTTPPETTSPNTTTSAPTTTPVPATTTKAPIPVPEECAFNVTVGNTTCIRAYLKILFKIPVEGHEDYIALSPNASTDGSKCGASNETQELLLTDSNYNVKFIFEKSSDNVYVRNISFSYVLPDSRDTVTNNTHLFNVKAGNSYLCTSTNDVILENVTMEVLAIKIQAFGSAGNSGFGTAEECDADNQVNDIVPIAVGVALLALVVVVLIAYLVGRRRSRQKGYQSV